MTLMIDVGSSIFSFSMFAMRPSAPFWSGVFSKGIALLSASASFAFVDTVEASAVTSLVNSQSVAFPSDSNSYTNLGLCLLEDLIEALPSSEWKEILPRTLDARVALRSGEEGEAQPLTPEWSSSWRRGGRNGRGLHGVRTSQLYDFGIV